MNQVVKASRYLSRARTKLNKYSRPSFSECAEDLILATIISMGEFNDIQIVDIGSGDPVIGSDSFFFSRNGFQCINIEPHPVQFKKTLKKRKSDLSINAAVSESESSSVNFLINIEPRLSKISEIDEKGVRVSNIQPKHILNAIYKDFLLKLDIEGKDFEILEIFLRLKPLPVIVCVETFDGLNGATNSPFNALMTTSGYLLISKTPLNSIYVLKSRWKFANIEK